MLRLITFYICKKETENLKNMKFTNFIMTHNKKTLLRIKSS